MSQENKFAADLAMDGIRAGVETEREHAAKLVEQMIHEAPWKDQLWARGALALAARAIRRGRHLTASEQLLNLAENLDDGSEEGARVAAYLRQSAGAGKA